MTKIEMDLIGQATKMRKPAITLEKNIMSWVSCTCLTKTVQMQGKVAGTEDGCRQKLNMCMRLSALEPRSMMSSI